LLIKHGLVWGTPESSTEVRRPQRSVVPRGQTSPEVRRPQRSVVPRGQTSPEVSRPQRSVVPRGQTSPEVKRPQRSDVRSGQLSTGQFLLAGKNPRRLVVLRSGDKSFGKRVCNSLIRVKIHQSNIFSEPFTFKYSNLQGGNHGSFLNNNNNNKGFDI